MRFTLPIIAALAAITAAQDYPFTEVVCETSDSSPYLHNVNELIDNLLAATGENLCNCCDNGCGETITDYSGSGGAALMVCGASMRCSLDPQGLPCSNPAASCGGVKAGVAGSAIEGLRDQCVGPDSNGDERVGGIQKTHYSADIVSEIRLFSKPG
ncbi:hypothetical protein BJY04DRAFT_178316 [Aspergillus karnatakaensis]|uniref:uncharacterized protein n=1 Tax=Aspergillus karnatakaensis TaxID=1810916 RepID=UPI003CCD3DC8